MLHYVKIRFSVASLDYVRKQLYSHFLSFWSFWRFFYYVTTTLSMLLLQQHIFDNVLFWYVQVSHKSYVIITLFLGLPLWYTYVTTTFFQVPKKRILITLEIRCLLVRSNYVRKYDTITLRVGSSFLDYLFCGTFP